MENIISGSKSLVIPHYMHKNYTFQSNPDLVCKVTTDISFEIVVSRYLNRKNNTRCKKYFTYLDTETLRKLPNNKAFTEFIRGLPEFSKICKPIVDFYYFTMDYSGKDLYELCLEKNKLLFENESFFKKMVSQLFKGLTYLHEYNVCHFDVKPENVTYNPMTKRFKYIDFGYAEIYPFTGYIHHGPRGTPDYIPVTLNASGSDSLRPDKACPYVECNDWVPRDDTLYNSDYIFYNKIYPELAYKSDTYALGKTLYYVYYYATFENDYFSQQFKSGIEALIFDLIDKDINTRPYVCNVKYKSYFKIKTPNLRYCPEFGSKQFLYYNVLNKDYGTILISQSKYSDSSLESSASSILSSRKEDANFASNASNASNASDASDTDSITSLEVQEYSQGCLSNIRNKFSLKKLISYLI